MSLLNMKKRAGVIFAIFFACLALLVIRLGYWQIIRSGDMAKAVSDQQNRKVTVTAPRGTIYDRNGKALAESASVSTLICNPQEVQKSGNDSVIAEELSLILGMDYEKIHTLLNKTNRYQVIKKRLSLEETAQVKELMDPDNNKEIAEAFSGISFEEDSKRYYSYNIAPHVIGFTGYDNNGLQGIELTFDEELSGKAGGILNIQSASGTTSAEIDYETYENATKGADIVLTIDETIQHFLEKHLETAVTEHELKEGAAGIIMNPQTGEILAMATKGDFNLNSPYDTLKFEETAVDFEFESEVLGRTVTAKENRLLAAGEANLIKVDGEASKEENTKKEDEDGLTETAVGYLTSEQVEKLYEERNAALRNKMWRNKAISDAYEPGSTFKIITAAAALEEGVVDLDTPFVCNGSKKVDVYDISCHNHLGHGPQTFFEGVLHSCNPVFMETGMMLGSEKFMEYFNAFGFTSKTGIELVGESGSIYYKDKKLGDTDLATSAFGQGFNITPIQLITAVSAVVNGGELMKPQIVKEIRNDTGIIKSYQPEVVNKVISEETSKTMREILEQVVSSPEGTGRNAYIKGYKIGGKTGTSEKGDRDSNKRIASFIGFGPSENPEIVCLVMLDEPQVANKFGGTIAAPLAGEIIEDTLEYLGIEKVYQEGESASTVEVPDVRNVTVEDAREYLKNSEFTVKVTGDGLNVVDQLPKPGVMLSNGSVVILYTEEDYTVGTVTVPNVSGLTLSEAKAVMKNKNLNFEAAGAGQNTARGAYAVKQSIEPGQEVAPGTVIGVEFRQKASD